MQPHWSWIAVCTMMKGAVAGALFLMANAAVGSAQDFLAHDYPKKPVRIVA
jgi:hypothetical protein